MKFSFLKSAKKNRKAEKGRKASSDKGNKEEVTNAI
jgi:hypothetical protein